MRKFEELKSPTSCLNKAQIDEPIFVLRAKDPVAAQAVRLWATLAMGDHEPRKLTDALAIADEMDKWRSRNCAAEVPSSSDG